MSFSCKCCLFLLVPKNCLRKLRVTILNISRISEKWKHTEGWYTYNTEKTSLGRHISYREIILLRAIEYLACYRFHRLTGSKFLVSYTTTSSYHCSCLRKLFRLFGCCKSALPYSILTQTVRNKDFHLGNIWGSHRSTYQVYGLLGCFLPQGYMEEIPPKCWYVPTCQTTNHPIPEDNNLAFHEV